MSGGIEEFEVPVVPPRPGLAEGWPDLLGGLLIFAVLFALLVLCFVPLSRPGTRRSTGAELHERRAQIEREVAAELQGAPEAAGREWQR